VKAVGSNSVVSMTTRSGFKSSVVVLNEVCITKNQCLSANAALILVAIVDWMLLIQYFWLAVWFSGNSFVYIIKVTLC